ncbi:hypothetical protein CP556_18510 [Natrinema sp. CBA1119]|uniref:hypothetical protein n=1 Tax=Natrinema sp. CBA1119 TaxID=1608465 RepID=UPI000BF99027|nr:hypothetical protein [Natrinema sp. CBA1119]PGF17898.1 hypothetical protein CP556_18510 [Natrinema sp. CBA1119]
MDSRIGALHGNKHFRTIVGTVGILALLVVFTDMTIRTSVPLILVLGAMVVHDVVDESHNLPEGANWLIYGISVFAVGTYWILISPLPWVGSFLALAGLWFVFDGVTAIRHGPSRETHEYISDLEEDQMGETLLRMQTLNVVYQGLRDAPEPQTAPELATDLDLTESRVGSALGFLEGKGRVEQEGDHYRAEPPRWGRLTPVVQFLVWVPRRIGRPFRRVTANA